MLRKAFYCILLILCTIMFCVPVRGKAAESESIIVATGNDVPLDYHLPEEYRFPAKYRENAVQFRTQDGVLICGYVLGEGSKGITLGHANGWKVNSWLPYAERLVDAGYMVILWSFRDNLPSESAPVRRWDLDVLAAAQVLRERGVTEIIGIGASDGGNATAVAAPYIPELVGIGILSSPAGSIGDGPAALSQITVPAFFAVSEHDPGGNFLPEVQALYDACASEQKEFHILTSYEHGSDLLSEEDMYSSGAYGGSTEEQKQERRQLAEDLMCFVNDIFGADDGKTGVSSSSQKPENSETGASASSAASENNETGTSASSAASENNETGTSASSATSENTETGTSASSAASENTETGASVSFPVSENNETGAPTSFPVSDHDETTPPAAEGDNPSENPGSRNAVWRRVAAGIALSGILAGIFAYGKHKKN